jgi:SAM-dependent methyltransferase
LTYAKARASEVGADNIEFHETANDFRLAIEPCDFFYSVIVLQHNPPPVILTLIRNALEALKPGGIALFQVPTYIVGYSFDLHDWLATDQTIHMEMHCVPQDAVMEAIFVSGCRLLSVREDGCSNATIGMVSNTFLCVK